MKKGTEPVYIYVLRLYYNPVKAFESREDAYKYLNCKYPNHPDNSIEKIELIKMEEETR